MKRRSRNWNKSNSSQESGTDAEESQSFTSGDDNQENGDNSSVDSEPKEKRRRTKGRGDASQEKKTITPKKRASRGKKAKESDEEDDQDNEEQTVVQKTSGKKKVGKSKKTVESDPEEEEDQNGNSEDDNEENGDQKKNASKGKSGKGRKSKAVIENSENMNDDEEDSGLNDDEAEYEVESILDEKTIKGIRYYLIRWKGYGEESDTWEPASTLSCPEALQEYKKKKSASKNSGDKSKKASPKPKKTVEPDEEWDENEDFEVVRILDVHFKRDGKKEFLVAWKGYSSKYDSWEPEENMNCKEMIEKFLAKCEQAKEATQKELRVMRKATDRFTLSSDSKGRRLSKRNQGKQRIQYHDAE